MVIRCCYPIDICETSGWDYTAFNDFSDCSWTRLAIAPASGSLQDNAVHRAALNNLALGHTTGTLPDQVKRRRGTPRQFSRSEAAVRTLPPSSGDSFKDRAELLNAAAIRPRLCNDSA
jgi:hypothetical protein